ncbi:glycosyltransferase [Chryseobacterium sp. KACC 21268]|nr:glycosyltransferase [Chryseobacterium sp. KACC 21268]
MIKILHIQETIGSGGVERRRLSLAKLLDKSKFQQKIICQHEVGNIGQEIRNEGVEIICLNNSIKNIFDIKQHLSVQKIIEDYKPDIIHGAVFEGVTMAAINGALKRVPITIIEETSDPQNRSWKANLLMKLFSFISDKVVGVSEGVTEDYLRKKLKVSDKKITLINNGVKKPREIAAEEVLAEKQKWGITEDDFVFGTVGRFKNDHHKRFSDLIKAFSDFSKDKNNVKLLMVGGVEEYLKQYRELAKELKVDDKIIFAGYQSDVTLYYKLMDVFTLVSAYEAFGLVLAEAMLNNLPVIATRVGGMKYIVDNNETGLLVEKFDIKGISSAMEQLHSDKILCEKMGRKGFEKAVTEYTEEVYVEKVSQLYEKLYSVK